MPILGVKGGGSESVYRGELDDYPEIFTFTNLIDVEPGETYLSEIINISGLNYRAKVSIVGEDASFSINGGSYISTTGFVKNGDTLRLSITPEQTFNANDFNKTTTAIVSVGRLSSSWEVKTRIIDDTPNIFSIDESFNIPISVELVSNYVILSGIEPNYYATATISSDIGLLQVNNNPRTKTTNVFNGDEIILIKPALEDTPNSYDTPTEIIVSVGGFSTTWTINPVSADITPDSFSFINLNLVGINTAITSNTITITGINSTSIPRYTVPISIGSTSGVNFSYSINGGAYKTTTGSVGNGDTISLKVNTPPIYSTSIAGIVTVGGITTSWNLITRDTPINTIPNSFVFNDVGNNQQFNTILTSNNITLSGISSGQSSVAFIANGAGTFRVTRNGIVIRDYSAAATSIQNNDVITLRLLSPPTYDQTNSTTFTVSGIDFNNVQGSRSDAWSITNYPSPDAPTVLFSVGSNPNANILSDDINFGDSTLLSWQVTGEIAAAITNVSLSGFGTVANSGSVTVSPNSTTVYTLTATGPGGTVSQNITINIPPAPSINSFITSPSPIPIGSNSTLSWDVSNVITSLSVNQEIGNVINLEPFRTISPTETTTYIITAIGPGGTTTASTTLNVIPPPNITFDAVPQNTNIGSSATLTWDVPNADTVSIDNGIGTVNNSGSTVVFPTNNTTYTLTATNISGTETSTVNVNVYPLPTVNVFTITPTNISAGNNATLSWNVSGSTGVSISGGIGAVAASGNRTVSPSSSTTYTLSATNAANGTTTATASIIVNRTPRINSFYASPSTINTGSSSTLIWSTTDTSSVRIVSLTTGQTILNNGSPSGSISVSPNSANSYQITATGSGGTATATASVNVTCSDTSINYRYGSGVCGSCASNICFGKYWRCTDGQYYGNVNQMGANVKICNDIHYTACGRYIRNNEIDSEVSIYNSLGGNPSLYLNNVQSRKSRTTQPLTVCGKSVTSLSGATYCNG